MASRIDAALRDDGVAVHAVECGHYGPYRESPDKCLQWELTPSPRRGFLHGSFLHAQHPMCIFFEVAPQPVVQTAGLLIGFVAKGVRKLRRGPAYAHDAMGAKPSDSSLPGLLPAGMRPTRNPRSCSKENAAALNASTDTIATSYARHRFDLFKQHQGCGTPPASGAILTGPPPDTEPGAPCALTGMQRFQFARHRSLNCWSGRDEWAKISAKVAAYARLVHARGLQGVGPRLYTEVRRVLVPGPPPFGWLARHFPAPTMPLPVRAAAHCAYAPCPMPSSAGALAIGPPPFHHHLQPRSL
jgi:hypothetical protein